jgi:hypothetical protein
MSHVNTRFATSPARVLRNRLGVMGIALLTALAVTLASAPSGFAASAARPAESADHGSKAKRCSHAKRTHDGRRCAKKTRHEKSRRTQPHRPAPPSAGQGQATPPPATSAPVTGSGGQAAPAACGAGVHCSVASCPNGAHNPPDCTVFGGPRGPITAGNPARSGGVSQLAFEYWNGWERFAHWSTCGYWLDQYWTDWSWAQSDYEYWRDQHFIALWPGRGY